MRINGLIVKLNMFYNSENLVNDINRSYDAKIETAIIYAEKFLRKTYNAGQHIPTFYSSKLFNI